MAVGEVDWEVFAAHLRAQGEEHLLDEYPEYAEWLRSKGASAAPARDEAAAPEAAAEGERVRVVERIVEREVLVIRCKLCQQITPVEQDTCKHCGQASFY